MEIHISADETISINKTIQVIVGAMGATELKSLQNEAESLATQTDEKRLNFLGDFLGKIASHPIVTAILAKKTGVMIPREELVKKAAEIVCTKLNEKLDEEFAKFENRLSALEKSDAPAEETPAEPETETHA